MKDTIAGFYFLYTEVDRENREICYVHNFNCIIKNEELNGYNLNIEEKDDVYVVCNDTDTMELGIHLEFAPNTQMTEVIEKTINAIKEVEYFNNL